MYKALLVDDDVDSSNFLIRSLEKQSKEIQYYHAKNSEDAQRFTFSKKPDVVVVDLSLDPILGPESGLKLINQLLAIDKDIRVLVLTGHNSKEWGIKAIQRGAASFIEKPASSEHLLALLLDGAKHTQLRRAHAALLKEKTSPSIPGLETNSAAMKSVVEAVTFAASTTQPILLLGETGVGKGMIAHAIHKLSPRKGKFIRFQPSYANHDLVASELFGHEKGSFTGATDKRPGLIEEANQGTLFLDEIDELPKETQVALLHVIQDRNFRRVGSAKEQQSNFRLIAATNYKAENLISDQKIREDFYHRIAHQKIFIPPLRERLEDIELLSNNFIRELCLREKIGVRTISPHALNKLQSHSWPGNVRELLACIESATFKANFCNRSEIGQEDISFEECTSKKLLPTTLSFRDRVKKFEYELINEALLENGNNQSMAAKILKIDRTTLRRILNRRQAA